jgi:hypothetical protein
MTNYFFIFITKTIFNLSSYFDFFSGVLFFTKFFNHLNTACPKEQAVFIITQQIICSKYQINSLIIYPARLGQGHNFPYCQE